MSGTECPRDRHPRTLVVASRTLSCSDRACRCPECHRQLSEAEAKEWARK